MNPLKLKPVVPGVARLTIWFFNVYGLSEADGSWVLVDTGFLPLRFLPIGAFLRTVLEKRLGAYLRDALEKHFGKPPQAIVLTHGHFDHVGNAQYLAEAWDVKIYTHPLEMPYLTERSDYPDADPTVGGALAFMSRFTGAPCSDLSDFVRELPGDGESGPVPELKDWRWIHTPGHAPGHISLWRESDRVLLAGDALATTRVDSLAGMFFQARHLSYAGAPYTCNWDASRDSAKKLAGLKPLVLVCGHGQPMSGEDLPKRFADFAEKFPRPAQGRYVHEPARTDENGVIKPLPPKPPDPLLIKIVVGFAAALGVGLIVACKLARR